MSRTLIYRTNQEFDRCAEHLRNILSVQESRQDSKSPSIRKANRKKQVQSSSKKSNSKTPVTKLSLVKTSEGRLTHSPNRNLHFNLEEASLAKNRLTPNKTRKCVPRSPSAVKNSRQKSPTSSIRRKALVRSSSCGDLRSEKSKLMDREATSLEDYLTRIRMITKQIRTRYSNITESECYHLWTELDKSLSSALSHANQHKEVQFSFTSLHNEMIELRKQLQTTNAQMHEYDLLHRNNEQYLHLQKKFDTNQIQCTQLALHNQELKSKSYVLQDKLDQLERNNMRLIQRLTEQDLCSISKRREWISTENRYLLCEEIIFLRKKLYHVYDDVSSLLSQNQTLENSIRQQKQYLSLYQQKFADLKHSAAELLSDMDNRYIQVKIKRFLNNILLDQHPSGLTKNSFHQTPTNVNAPPYFFEKAHISPDPSPSRIRPKSLFVTPNILNDAKAFPRFQKNGNPTFNVTYCSSSTIDDADSTMTSSTSQERKYRKFSPNLPMSTIFDKTKQYQQISRNESGPELDQISDLTSKMFGSADEDELPNGDMNLSTSLSSSSSIPSDAQKLMHM